MGSPCNTPPPSCLWSVLSAGPPVLRVRCQDHRLFIPIFRSLHFVLSTRLQCIYSDSLNIPSAWGHWGWNNDLEGNSLLFFSHLTQLGGETDLSLITDPLVTIIKLLISNALRLFQSAAVFTAVCWCRFFFVQGQSCMSAVLDCSWMSLSLKFRERQILYLRLVQSFSPLCFKDPLDFCTIHSLKTVRVSCTFQWIIKKM